MVCFDKFFYFFFFFTLISAHIRPIRDLFRTESKKKKKMVIDAHATVSMAAQRVRAYWTQLRQPNQHTRAFQLDGRDSDLVGVKNKTFLKDRPRRTISKRK